MAIANPPDLGEADYDPSCMESDCGFWNKDDDECSIASLGRAMSKLQYDLEIRE